MAISNHERVGRALNLLCKGLYPFVAREMQSVYTDRWVEVAIGVLPESYGRGKSGEEVLQTDISALLIVLWEQWHEVFKRTLGQAERSLVSELRETRNKWAHTSTFSADDAYRALDSAARLLSAISAPEADQIEKQKQELLRLKFEEQARQQSRRMTPIEGQPAEGLKPWREIVTPHLDIANGGYQQAEFAADLWQVYLDEGSDEYRDPTEFYRRTYITEGLRQLLVNALMRLSGRGGDPVIELQTNFGGGKTHAMLALYHLCNARQISDLPGMEKIFQEVNLNAPPQNVNIVVLVGNKLQPSGIPPYKPEHSKQNRPIINTLWGELAWQLGGAEGYAMVRRADETATNPGDTLKQLFNRYSPCLILIDEWVSYARQLHENSDLAGGSFDTQFTFAQTLSESAKNAKQTLLVVSVPASDIEVGGDRGKEALDRLKNAIGRVETAWRLASAEESFEIVRRRLFEPISDPRLFAQRDAVIRVFMQMYRGQSQEFPSECREADYERRMQAAYPIHPELFDRLYSDWSSLEKFQRTRGVLRLMAKVIHSLWERRDHGLLIMPAHVPMDDLQVQSELTRYLEENWLPVIDKDVDGVNSLPVALDRSNPNWGRYSACRRVARTIYMGSAPTLKAANRGLEDRQIKLGCVQPGEIPATFADALRRLADQATFIYMDGVRYWISTQPNVNRLARERAEQILSDRYPVWEEIIKRLRADKNKGEFSAVHVAPETSADIPDSLNVGARLVVLHPHHSHTKGMKDSPAYRWVEETLMHRGSSPRYYRNTLLFLAPDRSKLDSLERNVAEYLAWQSIVKDREVLNLDAAQNKQANSKREQSDQTVNQSIRDSYQWLLVPYQSDPRGSVEWKEVRLSGSDSPVLQASRKAVQEEDLIPVYSVATLLLGVLDPYVWRDRDHIGLQQLWDYMAQYLYLPRLKDQNVLLEAIRNGVESFAYADSFDEASGKYRNLRLGKDISSNISAQCLLVKKEVAEKQLAEISKPTPDNRDNTTTDTTDPKPPVIKPQKAVKRRFYGTVQINPIRINRDIPEIAEAVIQKLAKSPKVNMKITIEIEAECGEGFSEEVIRTVEENCQTLKFDKQAFEES